MKFFIFLKEISVKAEYRLDIFIDELGDLFLVSTWYHGTNETSAISICRDGINFSKSKKELDFGAGFYLSDDYEVAKRRAFQKTLIYNRIYKKSELPAIVVVSIDMEMLGDKKIKSFEYCDSDWLHFVIANRLSDDFLSKTNVELEHNRDLRYDVVVGSIADSDISEMVSHIDKGDISLSDISVYDVLTDEGRTLGTQMALHTERSLECVLKKEYTVISERRTA